MEEINKDSNPQEQHPEKQSISGWLDNFWYHYKWHSLIALFLIFTITVCSLQMCSKESYDIHVLYSGGHEINRQGVDGNTPEYGSMRSSISRVTNDFDENGKVDVTLKDLFMLSEDEIKNIESNKDGYEVNYALINENKSILRDTITYSSYYVCLISPYVYSEYKTIDGVEIFEPLAPLVKNGRQVEYYDEKAVYLSSTAFYVLPGISELPPDTLVCLRAPSVFASHFNKKDTERDYERGKSVVTKILNYE